MRDTMTIFGTIIVFGVILGCHGQVPSPLGCPKVDTIKNFNLTRYLGHWYEQARFPASFEKGQICANANYSIMANGQIKVFNYGQDTNGNPINATGEAKIDKLSDPGKLKLRFSDFAPWGSYWIVDTDYDTYTLIYSCTDFLVVHLELAWILTRDRLPDQKLVDGLMTKLASYNVNVANFIPEDQSNCTNINVL